MKYFSINEDILSHSHGYSEKEILEILESTLEMGKEDFYANLSKKGFYLTRTMIAPRLDFELEFTKNGFSKIT